jgi:beta-glucosidase
MSLPPHIDELISKVLDANPNTAIVIQSGTPVEMPWIQKAKAVLHAWYGGNETGNGIADVLFGDVNPVGAPFMDQRLPQANTFAFSV